MTASKQRWAWFLLACVVAVALLWTHRYEYAACDTDGCVAINRWSGAVSFRTTGYPELLPPEGTVVSRDRRPAARARPAPLRPDRPSSRGRTAAR